MYLSSSKSAKEKGYGLVEYAVILTFVSFVVVAVLLFFGPSIGGVFSSVNNSLSGITNGSSSNWIFAANENGTVNVPSGTHQIQYGANGHYFTLSFTGPTTVSCNNATFGDPIFGTVKSCSIQ
jgi:Flp pilus assembly pilin Flp